MSSSQGRDDLPAGQLRGVGRIGSVIEPECVGGGEIQKCLRRTGKKSSSADPSRSTWADTFPDQVLVGAGQQLRRFGQVRIPGDLTVMRPVQPDNLGQHVSIIGVTPGPGGGVPGPRYRAEDIGLIA